MILVDTSQVLISTITMEMKMKKMEPGFLRHMFFSKILSFKRKFPEYANRVVLALDDRNYWRKDIFPHYKGTRKKMRDKSDLDWDSIYSSINELLDDLTKLNIYKMVKVDRCEADDVMAIIAKYSQDNDHVQVGLMEEPEPILILSADTDLAQLQKYPNVKQYSPTQKKWVKPDNMKYFMMEHIMRGDTGDGVPNILSPDNCLMEGIRQTPLREKFIQEVLAMDDPYSGLAGEVLRNYQRNERLVNLDFIPEEYEQKIIEAYTSQKPKMDRMKLMTYMTKHKMKLLLENIQEF